MPFHSPAHRHQQSSLLMCTKALFSCERALPISLNKDDVMNTTISLIPIASLAAGILILVMPRLLPTIVAIYLIVVGLAGLFGTGSLFR